MAAVVTHSHTIVPAQDVGVKIMDGAFPFLLPAL
jgi:hypothetical protein